jgi:hypothetical protein
MIKAIYPIDSVTLWHTVCRSAAPKGERWGELMMSEIEMVDHQGIRHGFDVIKHALAGGDPTPTISPRS